MTRLTFVDAVCVDSCRTGLRLAVDCSGVWQAAVARVVCGAGKRSACTGSQPWFRRGSKNDENAILGPFSTQSSFSFSSFFSLFSSVRATCDISKTDKA